MIPKNALVEVVKGNLAGAVGMVAQIDIIDKDSSVYHVAFSKGTLRYTTKLTSDKLETLEGLTEPFNLDDLLVVELPSQK